MGLSRRFINMIVESDEAYTRSLHRIDLKRLQLFYPTPPPPPQEPIRRPTTTLMELPDPILKFQAHSYRGSGADRCSIACYPFGQRKVLSTDQAGRNVLYDVDTSNMAVMPAFHKPKLRSHRCLSLFVPSCDGEDEGEGEGEGGSLYLMVRDLRQVKKYKIEVGQPSMDFEVLVDDNGRTTSRCELLPLPPFVLPIQPNGCPEIRSYAVVGGGSHICVSVDGRGTYTLDTASHTWDKVGNWTLPFHGKVEYVPEFKLWFGLSGDARHLAAADLSTMNSRSSPQLAASGHDWEDLVDADLSAMDACSPPQLAAGGHDWEEFQRPEYWAQHELVIDQEDVQLVNLGSGRFCIARFFLDWRQRDDSAFYFVVLTGVEIVTRVLANGEVKLEMIPHKSMCHHKSVFDGTNIKQLF